MVPVIDYCDILYTGTNKDILSQLQRMQNKCLKTCMSMHLLTPTDHVHAEASLPTLENRRIFHEKIYAFKRSTQDIFLEKKNRVTRQTLAPIMRYTKPNCVAYEYSPLVVCARRWNSLSVDTRNINDFEKFKELAKKDLEDSIPEKVNVD